MQPGQHRPHQATLADLLAIPEADRFHEILDGELVRKAEPSGEHGSAQLGLGQALGPFNRRAGGDQPGGWWLATEVEIEFAARQVCRPDLVGWRRARVPEKPSGIPVRARPDWICEVLSSSNASDDTVRKMRLYHQHQVPHYWILDPLAGTLTAYRWTADGYLAAQLAARGECLRAEPFAAIEIDMALVLGNEAAS